MTPPLYLTLMMFAPVVGTVVAGALVAITVGMSNDKS